MFRVLLISLTLMSSIVEASVCTKETFLYTEVSDDPLINMDLDCDIDPDTGSISNCVIAGDSDE